MQDEIPINFFSPDKIFRYIFTIYSPAASLGIFILGIPKIGLIDKPLEINSLS